MSGSEWKREGLDQANLEEAMSELAHWRDRGLALRDRIHAFFSLERNFCKALSGSEEAPSLQLVTPAVRNMVKQTAKHPAVILPFFGSNSCGKSTLLNSLLGINVMPTGAGHVTGRICAISYAEAPAACIDTTTLDQFQTGDSTPTSSHPLGNLSIDQVREELRRHLKRPDVLPPDWVKQVVHLRYPFELLRSGVMLVDLPGTSQRDDKEVQQQLRNFFTAARPAGVCFLYSNPTFSDEALAALRVLMSALANTKDANVDPEIFFISTHLDTDSVLTNNGFFTDDNAQFKPEWLEDAKLIRWKLLQSAKKTEAFYGATEFPIPTTSPSQPALSPRSLSQKQPPPSHGLFGETSTTISPENNSDPQSLACKYDLNFSVANAYDYMCRSGAEIGPDEVEAVEFIFGEFRRRLLTFAVLVQRLRYETVYQRLLDGSARFFRLYNAYKSQDPPKRLREAQEARDAAAVLEKALIDASHGAIGSIQQTQREALERHRHSIWKEVDKATRNFDSQTIKESGDACLAMITQVASAYIRTTVAPEVLAEIDMKVRRAIAEVIQEKLASMNKNLMLGAALRNSVVVGSIQFPSAGIAGSMLYRFVRSIQNINQGSRMLTVVAAPFILVGAAVVGIIATVQKQFSSRIHIDESWRKTIMKRMMEDMVAAMDLHSLKDIATEDIKKFTSEILQHINEEHESITNSFDLFKSAQDQLLDMRLKFATYECECWIELRNLEGELGSLEFEKQPDLSASPSQAGSTVTTTEENVNSNSRFSHATWKTKQGEKRVLVKNLPLDASPMARLSFLEEAHYSLHIRQVSKESFLPPTLLPALAVHYDTRQHPPTSPTNQLNLSISSPLNTLLNDYVLIYDNVMGDLETLLSNWTISNPSSSSHPTRLSAPSPLDRIYFCLQAALGVESLHQYGVTHRKVTPRALWYRIVDGQYVAYLTDLSAATMSTANYGRRSGTQGVKKRFWDWEPPEIAKAAESLTMAMSSESIRSSSSSNSIPSSSSSASRSSRAPARRTATPARGYSRECDIWMLGKTIQWIINGGVEENDLESAKAKLKNVLQPFLTIPPNTQTTIADVAAAMTRDWFELVGKMLQDDPKARPEAAQVVNSLNSFINNYLSSSDMSSSPNHVMSEILRWREADGAYSVSNMGRTPITHRAASALPPQSELDMSASADSSSVYLSFQSYQDSTGHL